MHCTSGGYPKIPLSFHVKKTSLIQAALVKVGILMLWERISTEL